MVELIKIAVKTAISMFLFEIFGYHFLRDLIGLRHDYDLIDAGSGSKHIVIGAAVANIPTHIFDTFPFRLIGSLFNLLGIMLKLILKLILSIVDAVLGIIWNMIPIIRRFKQPRLSKLIKM